MGLRMLKIGYQHIPFTLKTEEGKRIQTENKAEEAATYLQDVIWGRKELEKEKEKRTITQHNRNKKKHPGK